MKINKLSTIIIIIVVLVMLVSSILFIRHKAQYQTKDITSFFNNDVSKINKIDIVNGNNGEIVSVDNKSIISNISMYLSKIKLTKVSLPPSTGWTYRFSIIENGNEVLNITFNGEEYCIINNSKYKIDKSTDIVIDSLYNEAKKATK